MMAFAGELAALSSAFLWAMASLIYRRVGRHIPPLELNLVKGLLALVLFGLTLFLTGDSLADVESRAVVLLLLSGVLGIGLGDSAYFAALNALGARRALLLGILAPPFAGLLAWIFLGEALSLGAWLGVLITVLGVGWVVTERAPGDVVVPGQLLPGISWGLLAALGQAGGAVLSRAAFLGSSVSPLWGSTLRLAAGVGALLVWLALSRQPVGRWLQVAEARRLWGWLLFTILTGTCLAIWLQQVALKWTSAGIAQTLLATSPLFVLPLAGLTGDKITARAVWGALVALVGIGLLVGLG